MEGKLTVKKVIEGLDIIRTNNKFCVGTKCRNFDKKICGAGKVVREILENGDVVCSNVTCPDPKTFFVGVTSGGSPICKNFPTNTCGTGQYVSKKNTDGSVVCANLPPDAAIACPTGEYIQKISSAHTPTCIADKDTDTNVFGKSCPIGKVLRGFTSTGSTICESLSGFIQKCRICFKETEGSSQCQGVRNSCTAWASVTNGASWTKKFRDDTDGRSGGCKYQWSMECK